MIHNDAEFEATQKRILLFERVLAEARQKYTPLNYQAMAEGYRIEIEQMQSEIRGYLNSSLERLETV